MRVDTLRSNHRPTEVVEIPLGTTTTARTTMTTAATKSATVNSTQILAVRHMSVLTLLAFAESDSLKTSQL